MITGMEQTERRTMNETGKRKLHRKRAVELGTKMLEQEMLEKSIEMAKGIEDTSYLEWKETDNGTTEFT